MTRSRTTPAAILSLVVLAGCAGGGSPYSCRRARRVPVIDGRLDDAAWRAAPWTALFRMPDGSRPQQNTRARALWDDRYLYVAFRVEDRDIRATRTARDTELWTEEVVEVFLEPTGTGRPYFEFEINPLNAVLDICFDMPFEGHPGALWRKGAGWDCAGWRHATRRFPSGWTAEMAFPWASFPGVRPPRSGTVWNINLHRIERPRELQRPLMIAWRPTPDPHRLSAMGRIVFEDH
jgi:hypothetical protein